MQSDNEYREVITLLNDGSKEPHERKLHRLPAERYTMSDCEFFFTICARHHKSPFLNNSLARDIIDALLWRKTRHHWRLFCYCLMPDHLHFIVQLPEILRPLRNGGARGVALESILDQVGDFKSYTTSQLWWPKGGNGQLWQNSSYDHVIRYNNSVESAVGYVLNNPARKSLVENWEDYPYAAIVDSW